MHRNAGIQVRGDCWHIRGPLEFAGTFTPPGDKSLAHRALLLAALASGRCALGNLPESEDVLRTRLGLESLGVPIAIDARACRVRGVGLRGLTAAGDAIDCGNSGTTLRLLLGVLAAQSFPSELRGDASLSGRPMRRVVAPLRAMGAQVTCFGADERPPLAITPGSRRLRGVDHQLSVDSAQVRSAILLAGVAAEGVTRIRPVSAARDHTERMLRSLGVEMPRDPEGTTLVPVQVPWSAFSFAIPGDLSAVAFFAARTAAPPDALCASAVGLNPGRMRFVEILADAGVEVTWEEQRSELCEPSGTLRVAGVMQRPLRIAGADTVRCIDEIPALLAGAVAAGVEARVEDAAELRVKESDRVAAMTQLLRAFGAVVHESADALHVEAGARLRAAHVHSRGDHRVAMAAAILAAATPGDSVVDGVRCVRTSYPGFADDFSRLARAR